MAKKRILCLFLLLWIGLGTGCSLMPSEEGTADSAVFEDYVKDMSFLKGTSGYTMYLEKDGTQYLYSHDVPSGPAACDIWDYDGDGEQELLILWMSEEKGIVAEMYEDHNGISAFVSRLETDVPAVCETEFGNIDIFRYAKSGKTAIGFAYECHAVLMATGSGFYYTEVLYDGEELAVSAETEIEGSPLFDDDPFAGEMADLGIPVEISALAAGEKDIADYLPSSSQRILRSVTECSWDLYSDDWNEFYRKWKDDDAAARTKVANIYFE